jgi:hypothetical protein
VAKVAGYTYFDVVSGKTITPKFKRRVEELDVSQELTRIDGTEEDVPEDPLDGFGRFYPRK